VVGVKELKVCKVGGVDAHFKIRVTEYWHAGNYRLRGQRVVEEVEKRGMSV